MAAKKKGKKVNKWIGGEHGKKGAIRHPGRVQRAAVRDNLSVAQEAEKMAHSGNKSESAAGRLALRFKGLAKHGNIRKHHGPRKRTAKHVARKA